MRFQIVLKVLILGLFLTGEMEIFGQENYVVTGKVVDSRNEPIEGVSVSIEGQSDVPVITDSEGKFSVTSRMQNNWLIFNPYEKYKMKRIFFSGTREILVYLTDKDIQSGEDIVLDIGLNREKKDVLSTINTVDTKNFRYLGYQSVDQLLQGSVSGVNFINHSGLPGTGGPIFMRGQTSLNGSNQPLIIVDGLPLEKGSLYNLMIEGSVYNPLSALSVQDISRISILKGAATTLYGLKGSNGVILIETLKPEATDTKIEFSFKAGMNYTGKKIPQLNSRQYKTLANEILFSSGYLEETFSEIAPALFLTPDSAGYVNYSNDYNWQEEIFSNSTVQDAHINILGGDAIGKYGLSLGYINYNGIFKNTNYNRFSSRFVGMFNMFEWLNIVVSANLVNSDNSLKESGLNKQTSPVLTSLAKSPMQFPYKFDENKNQLDVIQDVDEIGISNPKAVMDLFEASNSVTRFQTSFKAQADIISGLKFNSLVALNISSLVQSSYYPNEGMEYYDRQEVWNKSQELTNKLFSIFNDNYLLYTKDINSVHQFNLMAGVKWSENAYQEDFAIARNLNENDDFVFLQGGNSTLSRIGGNIENWNWLSGYGRINYKFKDRYLFELNTSLDLSSKVGREAINVLFINDLPYGTFYSGGFTWRLSEEDFLRNIQTLNNLSLNLQYGISGNDDVGTYSRQDYYTVRLFRETSGMIPAGFANPKIGYEKSSMYSAGTDISFRGNRLRLSFEYYNTNISDMIIHERLDSYLGAEEFPSNNASMVNTGYEFNVFSQLIKTNNFNLDVNFNLTKTENEITAIKAGEIITQLPGYSVINREGQKANSFYGYVYEGVFSSETEAQAANLVNDVGIPFRAGDAKFRDISGPEGEPDNVINNYDKEILGAGLPDIFGGLTFSVSYKNWNLSTLWYFVHGNNLFNYVRYRNEGMQDLSNQSITTLRRWTYEGQETDMPKARWNDPVGNTAFSSRWVEDGSYLRCKNIMLSYKVPEQFIMFRDLTVYANVINPFTFSEYLGYDPEFSYSFSPTFQGVDYGLMPQPVSVMFGFNLGL